MAIVQNIDLNLIPDSEAVVVKVNQYDDGTGRIKAHLYLNDTAYTPASGATVRIEGTKPDKHGFSYTASISGNTVTANLTTQMTAVAGRTRAQIIVEEPSGKTGTFAFWLDVQAAALADDTDISDTEIPAIMDLARENARKAEEAAENAEASAEGAAQSAEDASDSASAAAQSASDASSAASTASTKAGEAAASATSAAGSATAASGSATTASDYATRAKSWAVGPSGTGTSGTDTNNSKYWADQAAQSASEAEQYAQGGLIYRGSILFANIPTTNLKAGDMYNIEDDFTTDSRFQEGAGFSVKAGTNIAWNGTKWDLLAAGGGSEIQVVTMPTASADNVDDIVQFIGASTGSYTNGYFYKCIEADGTLPYDFGGSAVLYNDEIHILGGRVSGTSRYHYKWDGANWVSASTLPYDFGWGAAVVYNNEIHLLGGADGQTNHYKWDGANWVSVSTLPYNFYFGSAVVYNNEIHILGGSPYITYHYKWNGLAWTSVSTLPYSFTTGCAVVYNNELHIMGGANSSNRTSHYKWDGSAWTSASVLPYSLNQGSSVVFDNKIHILGGSGESYKLHYAWNGSEWSSVSTLPYSYYSGQSVIYKNKIHLLGGNTSSPRNYHYEWNGTDWISLMESHYAWTQTDVQPSGGGSGYVQKTGDTMTGDLTVPNLTATGDVTDGQGNTLKGANGNLATIETTTTASQAYGVGDYLVYNGQLYKVTTAIASGGTIVVTGSGANVVATTVILAINDMVGLALTASY